MGRPRKNINNKKVTINEVDKTSTNKQPTVKIEQPVYTQTNNENSINKPRKTHVVQRGENIRSIAGMYSVPVMKLIRLNNTESVSVGQTIYID